MRSLLLILLGWTVLGVAFSALLVLASDAGWVAALLFAVPLTLVYGSASGFSAFYLCRAYPLGQRAVPLIIGVVLFAAICAATLWTAAGAGWHALWQALAPDTMRMAFGPAPKTGMFAAGVLLYAATGVLNYLVIEAARARIAERRELELALQARDAELRMLRTQIDPHFLFNSLNSISALTAFDADGARAMTLRLADFFRHSLGLEAHRKVTLAQELLLVRHFVAIEQVRFAERLRFDEQASDEAGQCLVPPMILQPLVENAVKHGIGGLTGGGEVRVQAVRSGSLLRITIDNDVDGAMPPASTAGKGIGLANVRARLATAYGSAASVHWRREGAMFRVEMTLPADTEEK